MKRISTIFAALVASVSLMGCAQTFIYNGQHYSNPETFQQAYRSEHSSNLAAVFPLQQYVSPKRLIISIPSSDFYVANEARLHSERLNRAVGHEEVRGTQLIMQVYEDISNIAEMIQRKNLYQTTDIIRHDSRAEPQANSSTDVVYLYMGEKIGQGGGWYFIGGKTGKQVISIDRAKETRFERVASLIDAIKSAAILNKP